jgi:transcriptional antiterminator RfaH
VSWDLENNVSATAHTLTPAKHLPAASEWYLIKTKSRGEELAVNSLDRYEIISYLPRLFTRGSGASRNTLKSVPLFPGYLFFQLETTSSYWKYIRWAPGVDYILQDAEGVTSLPDSIIQEILLRQELRRKAVLSEIERAFKPAEKVQITSGPLAGLEAIFERPLSASDRVQVLIQILGRATSVTLEKNALTHVG